jgi:hypothetical protein
MSRDAQATVLETRYGWKMIPEYIFTTNRGRR